MRNRDSRNFVAHFVVHTRSASFDYKWVYGLQDRAVEDSLQTYLLEWLGASTLAKLPPVITFFRFNKYYGLMRAQASETRTDPQERSIFERAVFLWEPVEGLFYRHLGPLAVRLERMAAEAYGQIPNNTTRAPHKILDYEVSFRELDQESNCIRKSAWELPSGFSWSDVIANRLTVEVPDSWSFDQMVAGLAEYSLTESSLVFIGKSLHVENRLPINKCWMISAKSNGETASLPKILGDEESTRVTHEAQPKRTTTSAALASGAERAIVSQSNHSYEQHIISSGEKLVLSEDKLHSHNSEELDSEIDARFAQLVNAISNREGKLGIFRRLKHAVDIDHGSLLDAQRSLLLLLVPVSGLLTTDLVVAWHFLLEEIVLSYDGLSRPILDEWIRRLAELNRVTNKTLSGNHHNWCSKFNGCCDTLRSILYKQL